MAFGVAGGLSSIFINNIRVERRTYWVSWSLASSLISLSLVDRGWRAVAIGAAACVGMAFLYAYLRTSYIKIGGRIYTYTLFRNRPDVAIDGTAEAAVPPSPTDAYGNFLTAPKLWWTIVVFALPAASLAMALGLAAATIGGGLFVTTVMAFTGYIDAYEGFSVARRQRAQLAFITVASIPLLLLPLLAYAMAYLAGRRSAPPGDTHP
jgi:hypothetical protein